MKNLRPLLAALTLTTLLCTPALGQTPETSEPALSPPVQNQPVQSNATVGLRAGYTDWDGFSQIHLGAHLKMGEVFPNVQFTPNVEAGFGDDVTIITLNGDLAYNFTEFVAAPWNMYGGGALSFNYLNPQHGDSDTDLGLSALLGLEYTFANENAGMVEIRLGLMDSPDFKLTFGYTLF